MSKALFSTTSFQQEWLTKLEQLRQQIEQQAQTNDEQARFPKQSIQSLIDMGYTSLALPTSYEGSSLSTADLVLFQETLGSMDGSTALSISWHQGVVGEIYEKRVWTEEQLSFFAKEIKKGALVNRAVSEAQTGSPTRGGRPGTHAVRSGDSWVINGEKTFTSMSPYLTYYLVGVWIEEKQAVGFFLIHRDTEGISIRENWDMVGMRSTESHDLVLKNVKVEDFYLVEVNDGSRGNHVNAWMTHIPANYLGIAQAARDYAVTYATEHSPNSISGTISELPNVQTAIGEMELLMMQSRHLIYSVTRAYDDEHTRPHIDNEIGVVKHTVVNNSIHVVDKAMRIVGAKSLELSCPLQRYYRDIRAGLHNPPMDDMTITKLAKKAIDEVNHSNE
ncbi:acyl-CoA dehydrogenase family protein [Alkalicoccobacillus murimartini]|uniref:Alkylation response protein AidB-like acyl-CoA dehydrogenase n=1 Tax=Alkalicoccobacillus murimartini TaxID=171685 RepID=A0ABT9YNK0_9BACI|nr:acyl-CoA dehydrogenase family protein [Alkalicoccobacillus murimartini]MDQ0209173.1 alkylation response protein AidB-like acyl-CoA dehydrogenase [Alkalicoccobacillus murimartini]